MKIRYTVTGVNLSRLLTDCTQLGIRLYYIDVRGLSLYVSVSRKHIARFEKCLSERGYTYSHTEARNERIGRLVDHIGLTVGIVAVILMSIVYSHFVLDIRVTGYSEPSKVFRLLESVGVEVPSLKKDVDTDRLERILLYNLDISLASVALEGGTLVINVKQSLSELDIEEDVVGAPVYSLYDGVVTRIVCISGTPTVRVGQAVSRGELLLDTYKETSVGRLDTSAVGVIFGKVYLTIDTVIPNSVIKSVRTGEQCTLTGVEIFGRRSPVSIPYTSYEIETSKYNLSDILPIYGIEYRIYETENIEVVYEPDIDVIVEEKLRLILMELPEESSYLGYFYTIREEDGFKVLSLNVEIERIIGGGV